MCFLPLKTSVSPSHPIPGSPEGWNRSVSWKNPSLNNKAKTEGIQFHSTRISMAADEYLRVNPTLSVPPSLRMWRRQRNAYMTSVAWSLGQHLTKRHYIMGGSQKTEVVHSPVTLTLIPHAPAGDSIDFSYISHKIYVGLKNDFALETSIVYINICFLWEINGKG